MNRTEFDRMVLEARNLANEQDSDALLFLGSPTDPIPRALIIDSDLPFEARILWCYFRSLSDSPGSAGISPDYDTIQKELGIRRRNTVSNSINALHIARWITVMSQAGQQRRIYLLHVQPLTYEQAVELDPGYTDRLSQAMRNPAQKIRNLATRVLDGAMNVAGQENTPCADLYRLTGYAATSVDGEGDSLWTSMYQRPEPPEQAKGEPDPDPGLPEDGAEFVLEFHDEVLAFSPSMRNLATMKLQFLPPDLRQRYLDDLAVRVLERGDGEKPIRTPISYLQWMVNQYHEKGDIVLSGKGDHIHSILDRREQARAQEARKPILKELADLKDELNHFQRLSNRRGEPDDWIRGHLHETGARINELERQLHAVDTGDV